MYKISYRFRMMHERIEAIQQIWTGDIAACHGDSVNSGHVSSWPVQRPHPPALVAGNGPRVAERLIAHGAPSSGLAAWSWAAGFTTLRTAGTAAIRSAGRCYSMTRRSRRVPG
jgi:alkanesulfonate monooxygenase SsuD/methylene tetrahydromethanopterin reductase-like flavin-dependent oxidoreductase (luciferase family)